MSAEYLPARLPIQLNVAADDFRRLAGLVFLDLVRLGGPRVVKLPGHSLLAVVKLHDDFRLAGADGLISHFPISCNERYEITGPAFMST